MELKQQTLIVKGIEHNIEALKELRTKLATENTGVVGFKIDIIAKLLNALTSYLIKHQLQAAKKKLQWPLTLQHDVFERETVDSNCSHQLCQDQSKYIYI